nr:Arm DNA-binding domain-containing protein [Hoylesella timonensis]
MEKDKMKVLLYLKKSGLDKSGQAPIMGRITYERTIAQFSCKLSCNPKLWNARESRLNGKSREAVATNGKLDACFSRYSQLIESFASEEKSLRQLISKSSSKEVCKLKSPFWNDTTEWLKIWHKR